MQECFDFFLSSMLEQNARDFYDTDHCKNLRKKLEKHYKACERQLEQKDFQLAEIWIEAVMEWCSEESQYLYRQAYKDCISLLKKISVL